MMTHPKRYNGPSRNHADSPASCAECEYSRCWRQRESDDHWLRLSSVCEARAADGAFLVRCVVQADAPRVPIANSAWVPVVDDSEARALYKSRKK